MNGVLVLSAVVGGGYDVPFAMTFLELVRFWFSWKCVIEVKNTKFYT